MKKHFTAIKFIAQPDLSYVNQCNHLAIRSHKKFDSQFKLLDASKLNINLQLAITRIFLRDLFLKIRAGKGPKLSVSCEKNQKQLILTKDVKSYIFTTNCILQLCQSLSFMYIVLHQIEKNELIAFKKVHLSGMNSEGKNLNN